MACSATGLTEPVNLEVVINLLTGTEIGQTVGCGYTPNTPYVDDQGLLHIFSNLDVHYDVGISDTFAVACAPGVPLISVPLTGGTGGGTGTTEE